MKKIIFIFIFLFQIFSLQLQAHQNKSIRINNPDTKPLQMEAGLWKIKSLTETDGKQYDSQEEYKKMLSAVPSDQRKKVIEALQKSIQRNQSTLNTDGSTKLCYSKKLLENPLTLTPQNKNCETTVIKKTTTLLRSSFSCKDSTTGSMEWNLVDRKKFKGIIITKDTEGIESKTLQTGNFVSSKCGSLKSFKTR